jgi:hypothetical protein
MSRKRWTVTRLAVIIAALALVATMSPMFAGTSTGAHAAVPAKVTSSAHTGAAASAPHAGTLWTVVFFQENLPTGASWSVTFNGTVGTSTNNTAWFYVVNGTYNYSVSGYKGWTPSPATGSVVVNGMSRYGVYEEPITFLAPGHYTVTFNAIGLPTGTMWTLTYNGTHNITSTTFSTVVLNSTNPFSVAPVPAFTAAPKTGSIIVNGAKVTQNITFTATKGQYLVIFKETGLGPSVTTWTVTYNTTEVGSAAPGNQIQFSTNNSTNPYKVTVLTGYRAVPASGNVTVAGASVTTSIAFTNAPGYYDVTFKESGLATTVTSFSVTFNGNLYTSTAGGGYGGGLTVVTSPTQNGSAYPFTVTPITGYTISPATGNVAIAGYGPTVYIAFMAPLNYSVTFHEIGLPTDVSWRVSAGVYGGRNPSLTAYTPADLIYVNIDGTYYFTVRAITGYQANPSSGNVTISGANQIVDIHFSKTYMVTFTETGLTAGTSWTVTFNGTARASATTAITFTNVNGTSYAYTVTPVTGYTVAPPSGTVTIAGANPANVTIVFARVVQYAVTFSETGYVGGAPWYVTVNDSIGAKYSTSTSVVFPLLNGSYSFTVTANLSGYYPTPASGDFKVAGAVVSEPIVFSTSPPSHPSYNVWFNETGLPSATSWSVTFNSTLSSSATASIQYTLENGNYTYTVTAVTGYTASPASGSVWVNGAAQSVAITFTAVTPVKTTYAVTFTESGLPSGTSWGIVFNGTQKTSTSTTVDFMIVNGSYSFTVIGTAGYTPSPTSGQVTVAGAAKTVPTIAFAVTSCTTGCSNNTSSGSSTMLYIIVIVVVVVVVAVVVLMMMMRKKKAAPAPMPEAQGGYPQQPYQEGGMVPPPQQ